MEISQFSGMLQSNGISATSTAQSRPPPPPPQDELSDYMDESSEDTEVKAFMESVMEMEASGTFDAESLAANAPASMKEYAEENGVDLKSFFEQKHEQHNQRGSMPPPPPANQAGNYASTSMLGSAESTLMETLSSSISINTTA
ncbi:hypothetical protein [Aestuariibacter sp. A3R04]|uniref:hypothetical protein n=1 Tax=Aestuariibacter sp. A3R04 TaxID=2841571 RepID=UPI001C09F723|nr:hypothetical protein [Aestuariibacter sp. A3R04]MBU3023158.1 hypothetical protein [Aestuariibacter sp. A3R04]